jgi:ABC-2 type transport system ATP-binding protein
VVFLDEPTTGLDTRSRQDLWGVIRHLADNGTTVLLTTQYLEEADQLADRIAVLENGSIVAEGTAGELKARIGGEVVAIHDADGDVVREIPTDGTVAGLRAALDGLGDADAASVSLRSPSLDDVFLALTGPTSKENRS